MGSRERPHSELANEVSIERGAATLMEKNMSLLTGNRWTTVGLAFGFMVCVGLVAGFSAYFGSQAANGNSNSLELPLELQAATSARSDSLSMATGAIEGQVEGLWLLDHVTGNLQCWVLNPRTGGVAAIYSKNVTGDLAVGNVADADLMMVTGVFLYDGRRLGNARPGQCICYVAEAKSGNVVGYGFFFNNNVKKQGGVQAGPLEIVCKGKVRQQAVEREQ